MPLSTFWVYYKHRQNLNELLYLHLLFVIFKITLHSITIENKRDYITIIFETDYWKTALINKILDN